MKRVEGTGTTLEEAQKDALNQLEASAEEVEFEVLDRPGTFDGILGRRSGYRVAATLADTTIAEQAEAESEASAEPQRPAAEADASDDLEKSPEEHNIGETAPPNAELAEAARSLLQKMIDLMGIEGEVRVEGCSEDEVRLNVEGEDMGLLIGRHGATLDAVQLIVAIGANRQVEDGARVIVDAENYRRRHREMIEGRALKLAEEAKEHGREVVVPDLQAYERRLVHMALKDDPDVETYSEGTGDDRVLVISPV